MAMMNRLARFMVLAAFLGAATTGSAGSPETDGQSWPAVRACAGCLGIQVAGLKFRLPGHMIESVNILNMPAPTVNLMLSHSSGVEKAEITLLALTEDEATGGLNRSHYDKLSVKSAAEFFDRLAESARADNALKEAQSVMGVDEASGYRSYKSEKAKAYWLQHDNPVNRQLFVLLHGEPTIYLIAGDLDRSLVELILATIQSGQ
jgi:hypothetical protein